MTSIDTRVLEIERDFLLEQIGYLDIQLAEQQMIEGAWTGSMGGHDPDFDKLRGGLMKFWREKAVSHPHPFTYCVRHLSKHVANPERLCAWLKDQALGTTKWRNTKKLREANLPDWQPSIEELRSAVAAYEEAIVQQETIEESVGVEGSETAPPAAGGTGDEVEADGADPNAAGSEAGSEGAPDPDTSTTGEAEGE